MKTNLLSLAALVVGAAVFGAAQQSSAQIAAFQTATPNAVFGASRVPAETAGLFPSVIYKATAGKTPSVAMRLDVVGMLQSPLYAPVAIGGGHIIGAWPTVSLPADTAPIVLANRRPTTTKGPDWRFAIYGSVAAANNAIAAWSSISRGAAVLEPTAAQDKKLQWVDTRALEWIDPTFDPLAPAAGSLVGFNYTSAKNLFFTPTYLTGKVIVIYGPARVNTAAKTGTNAQNIGYATRDAYWVTPALR